VRPVREGATFRLTRERLAAKSREGASAVMRNRGNHVGRSPARSLVAGKAVRLVRATGYGALASEVLCRRRQESVHLGRRRDPRRGPEEADAEELDLPTPSWAILGANDPLRSGIVAQPRPTRRGPGTRSFDRALAVTRNRAGRDFPAAYRLPRGSRTVLTRNRDGPGPRPRARLGPS
jgi:hypothetical protein